MNRSVRTIAGALALGALALTACSAPARSASDGDIGLATIHDSGDISVELHSDSDPVRVVTRSAVSPVHTFYARTEGGSVVFEDLRADLTYSDGSLAATEVSLRQGDLEQVVDIKAWS